MRLPVQNRLVVLDIFIDLLRGDRFDRFWGGHHFPFAVAHPRTLLLGGILDVEQAEGFAVQFQLVFHFPRQGQGLRPRQVDARVLKLHPVEHRHRNHPAGLGLAQFPGPLKNRDRTQVGGILDGFLNLPRVLTPGERGTRESAPRARASRPPATPQ